MKNKIIYILILLFAFTNTYGQEKREEYRAEFAFALDSSVLDSKFRANEATFASFTQKINELLQDSTVTIDKIIITSKASPEGDVRYNKRLSEKRSNSVKAFIDENVDISLDLLEIHNIGVAWDMLQDMVTESKIENKSEILHIINNVPEETWSRANPTDRWLTLTDSRNKHLMDLHYGIPYRQMEKDFFPSMRSSSVVSIYYRRRLGPVIPKKIDRIERIGEIKKLENLEKAVTDLPFTIPSTPAKEISFEKQPLFAVKTNLLFDVATITNVELEVPVSKRWSVAGEWIFPWWVTKDNGNALQVLSGNIEGKYWLGSDSERAISPVMTGWFAGLYAGGGLYDLQYRNNGYQGEFYIAAGLSGGYAHTINKSGSLRMEYSLGLGYMKTNYRYYEGRENNKFLVWQYNGSYRWLGPTKAKVSLVWLINRNRRKR